MYTGATKQTSPEIHLQKWERRHFLVAAELGGACVGINELRLIEMHEGTSTSIRLRLIVMREVATGTGTQMTNVPRQWNCETFLNE